MVLVRGSVADAERMRAREGEQALGLLARARDACDVVDPLGHARATGRAQADVEIFLAALRDIGAVRQVTDGQSE